MKNCLLGGFTKAVFRTFASLVEWNWFYIGVTMARD